MPHNFTTLRHPVEKLLEAEHFLARLSISKGLEFQFELNAFLSASRSVTFVLQKSMSNVPGFAQWYVGYQARIKADPAMRFFMELRNLTQKEGPVSIVAGALRDGRWTHRFVGTRYAVPEELVERDIGAVCAAHLAKLGSLLLECVRTFPFHVCPAQALTEEGRATLGYTLRDVEAAIGLTPGYTEVANIPTAEKLRILRREFEPLDTNSIERIANGNLRCNCNPIEFQATSGPELVDEVVALIGPGRTRTGHPHEVFVRAVRKRVDDSE